AVMPGERVAPLRTAVTATALHEALRGLLFGVFGDEPSHNCVAVLVAQSAFETNRWRACMNWNLGGIKSDGSALHAYYTTTEVVRRAVAEKEIAAHPTTVELAADDGHENVTVRVHPDHPWCRFRAYRSLEQSAAGFVGLLANPRYRPALDAARDEDPERFVRLLKVGQYFTGDVESYVRNVCDLFEEFADPPLSTMSQVRSVLDRLGFETDVYIPAVKAFQAERGLELVDGIVGRKTKKALRLALKLCA
ncbi:MAG: hypothetical protein JWM74_1216, partial [Myxococcaceae bacterium]|nr:hypothetical protein [Myxococcaceae bacterium]